MTTNPLTLKVSGMVKFTILH